MKSKIVYTQTHLRRHSPENFKPGNRSVDNAAATIRTLVVVVAVLQLTACSEAAFGEMYGPRGGGLVGSAYGYGDRRLSETTFRVEYTDAAGYAADAHQGATRRARELCAENGFVDVVFAPTVVARGEFMVAAGVAECLSNAVAETEETEGQRRTRRLSEIDAEIAALQSAMDASNDYRSILSGPFAAVGAAVASDERRRMEETTARLRAERADVARLVAADEEAASRSLPSERSAGDPAPASMSPPSGVRHLGALDQSDVAVEARRVARGYSCSAARDLHQQAEGGGCKAFATLVNLEACHSQIPAAEFEEVYPQVLDVTRMHISVGPGYSLPAGYDMGSGCL